MVDTGLSALGPDVGFLAARVAPDGTCDPIHAMAPSTARPTGSQFKLFVLGALASKVDDGEISWKQTMTMTDTDRSIGNSKESGSIQFAPAGTEVPVEEAATKMISISDNTAADLLIGLVGRDAVEDQLAGWSAHASANRPFITTREMILLHYIDDIEWFASPTDICHAFAGLQQLSKRKALSPTLSTVLSRELGTIGLEPAAWPTVWFKGGSEPGVLTLGWLATTHDGRTFVVEAMVSNPDASLAEDSITDLVSIAHRAFGLLE